VKVVVFAGAAFILAALTAACSEPPVKPIPDAARKSVTAVSADIQGVRTSDTSTLGARGSDEGGRLGSLQGAATVLGNSNGSLLGLVLAPIGAAVGAAKGASEARSPEIVDEARTNLRLALQETDFTELLKQRLAASRSGTVTFTTVTAGAASAPAVTGAGAPVGHVIALEYRMDLVREHLVNPAVGVYLQVSAQVQSPDRRQMVHTATWHYCGPRADFVQMGANNGAGLRAQIAQAAAVLGEAIPYDLYVSRQPRSLKAQQLGSIKMFVGCMDFSDLPSRTGQVPVILEPPIPLAPAATSSAPAPTAVTAAAPAAVPAGAPALTATPVAATAPQAPSPGGDGTWQLEMGQLVTTYGTTVGGECPANHSMTVTFAGGSAEGPWGKLSLTASGEVSGWMTIPRGFLSTLPFIVNLSGRTDNAAVTGTVSGRCIGSFTMRKQQG
jgi:hypothetical protein